MESVSVEVAKGQETQFLVTCWSREEMASFPPLNIKRNCPSLIKISLDTTCLCKLSDGIRADGVQKGQIDYYSAPIRKIILAEMRKRKNNGEIINSVEML